LIPVFDRKHRIVVNLKVILVAIYDGGKLLLSQFKSVGRYSLGQSQVLDQKRFVETLREKSDLVSLASDYLVLKKSGQNYAGLCPFHTEKSPSFVISPGRQLFHCFGCGVGGDIFQFLMKISGTSFPEALSQLAKKAGIPLPPREGRVSAPASDTTDATIGQIYALNREAADYFHQNLLKRSEAAIAMDYLAHRGITRETIKQFLIGYALPSWDDFSRHFGRRFSPALLSTAGFVAPDTRTASAESGGRFYDRFRNRILFPIQTRQEEVVGFGGRVLDDSHPKYLNTPETPTFVKGRHLFGLDQAHRMRKEMGKASSFLVIVEGYFDVIAAHQAGVYNVVGTMGTALTTEHLTLIRRVAESVVLLFDPDDAGLRAARRGAVLCMEKGMPVRVATLPAGEDPDLYIRRRGRADFLSRVQAAVPAIEFFIRHAAPRTADRVSQATFSIEEKALHMEEVLPLIGQLKTMIEQSHYLKMFADTFGVSEEDVRIAFSRHKSSHKQPAISHPQGERVAALMQDEALLLSLLLQGKYPSSTLNDRLCLNDFTNPQIKGILQHFWNETERKWEATGLTGLSDRVAAEELSLLARLSVASVPCDDNLEWMLHDCIVSLRKRGLQREGHAIQESLRLAEREQDLLKISALQQKFFNLKKELSLLLEPTDMETI
jgi:DNA primase